MKRTAIRRKRPTPRRRPVDTWTADDWADADLILQARAGYACERCGKECGPVQRHHRKRRREGGESYPNVILLGMECHAWCHAHPALARKYGWIVSVSRDPVTVPMLWRSRQWVFLTTDGGMVDAFAVEDAHAWTPTHKVNDGSGDEPPRTQPNRRYGV